MTDKITDIENVGLLPKIWGPWVWNGQHAITFAYPESPTEQDKQNYRIHFETLGHVLPCCNCGKSYTEFIKTGDTCLTDNDLKDRKSLTHWLWRVHNVVNKKLGIDYDVSYEMLCKKFESYRAVCDITPELKAIAFKNASRKEVPILNHDYAYCFAKYAEERGVENFEMTLFKTSKLKKYSESWYNHNAEVLELIQYMRLNAITAVEQHGKYKGLPTYHELEIIKRMSTTLSKTDIITILTKMGITMIDSFEFTK